MSPPGAPDPIDLAAYKKAAQARARAAAKAQAATRGRQGGGREPFLGSRPRAGLLLILAALALLAMWIVPRLL